MEDLSDCTTDVLEFIPFNKRKVQTQFAEISTSADRLPALIDKSVETNQSRNAKTQTKNSTIATAKVDENKLYLWLKRIYPFVESELLKGPTPISDCQVLKSNTGEEELTIELYQKISLPSRENFQGLATWLSIYTNNTPVLVLTTTAAHDDWCEHVDQSVKVYIPKRMQSSYFVGFEELKSIPTKACLGALSTNPFDKNIFAGSTVSGDIYIWKFVSNKQQGEIDELFCGTHKHENVVDFDWPCADRMLTCHSNGWVCLWLIGKHIIKEGDFLLKSNDQRVLELTTIVTVSLTDFIVGCADGSLYHCLNTNMGSFKTEIEINQMKKHKFCVTSLLKKDVFGSRIIVSCDLSGEVLFHDLMSSDDEGLKVILRIPLPFQNNIVCSNDGKIILCPGIDGSLEIYCVSYGKHSTVKGALLGRGNMIKISDNSSWIVTGLYGGDFQVFSLRN